MAQSPKRSVEDGGEPSGRLRSACDACHHAKVRCSGGTPCVSCAVSQILCIYSVSNRLGRPKGSKNKRTLVNQERAPDRTTDGNKTPSWMASYRRQHKQRGPPSGRGVADPVPDQDGYLPKDNAIRMERDPSRTLGPDWLSWLQSIGGDLAQADSGLLEDLMLGFDSPLDAAMDGGANTPNVPSSSSDDSDNFLISPMDVATKPRSTGHNSVSALPEATGASSSSSQEGFACPCLPQLIRLVYHLEDLQPLHASTPSIDHVLRGARQAQGPWNSLMCCAQCRDCYNHEVFLLFAMSIRTLLSSVQMLYTKDSQGTLNQSMAASLLLPPAQPPFDVGILVGSYELTTEEKCLTFRLMIRNTLRSVVGSFIYLQEYTQRLHTPARPQAAAQRAPAAVKSLTENASAELLSQLRRNQLDVNQLGEEEIDLLIQHLQCMMRALKDAANQAGD